MNPKSFTKIRTRIIGASLVLLIVLLGGITVRDNLKQKRNRQQRIADIRNLTETYLGRSANFDFDDRTSNNWLTIEQVIQKAQNTGVKLNNQIPEDPTKPCYRLVYTPQNPHSEIVIEETNITDKVTICRSYFDGAIVFQKRDQQQIPEKN